MTSHANLNATVGIFFDSFAKIAVSIAVLGGVIHLDPSLINKQIIPSICVSLFILNYAYFWQAKRLKKQTAQAVTALPSGLQASCVFVWLFALMLPIASKTHNPLLAYQVALLANLLNGIFFTIFGLILIRLKNLIPPPALFSGLAGTAFTWLAVNNLPIIAEHPLSGLLPLLVILGITLSRPNTKLPLIMLGVIAGTLIAVLTHEFNWQLSNLNLELTLHLPHFVPLNISHAIIDNCLQYLPLILAFALIDAISAVQILEESKLSGDIFNPNQSILISGIISSCSSFIGNPFAMALFFGHYSWKKSGATENYSLYNSLVYLVLGLSGSAIILINLIPEWVTLPILIIIGITTTAISFGALKPREHILLVIGMIPILIELIYNKLEIFALQNNITNFMQQPDIAGLFILAKGSILFSLLLTTAFYYIMNHKWLSAAISCGLLSLFCSIGFIHSQTPSLHFMSQMNYIYLISIICCLIPIIIKKYHVNKI